MLKKQSCLRINFHDCSIDEFGCETNKELTNEAKEQLRKVKKGTNNVIHVKSQKSKTKSDLVKQQDAINKKLKAYTNDLLWEASIYKDIAAIRSQDGSRLTSGKSKFKQALISQVLVERQS